MTIKKSDCCVGHKTFATDIMFSPERGTRLQHKPYNVDGVHIVHCNHILYNFQYRSYKSWKLYEDVKVAQATAIPRNIKECTVWAVNVWQDWRADRCKTNTNRNLCKQLIQACFRVIHHLLARTSHSHRSQWATSSIQTAKHSGFVLFTIYLL